VTDLLNEDDSDLDVGDDIDDLGYLDEDDLPKYSLQSHVPRFNEKLLTNSKKLSSQIRSTQLTKTSNGAEERERTRDKLQKRPM
jgi:hypothetical protein